MVWAQGEEEAQESLLLKATFLVLAAFIASVWDTLVPTGKLLLIL